MRSEQPKLSRDETDLGKRLDNANKENVMLREVLTKVAAITQATRWLPPNAAAKLREAMTEELIAERVRA